MIKATITGNIGKDAELKTLSGGYAVASFSVASNTKVKGEKVTSWVRVSLWGKRASALTKYLTKGTTVAVFGDLSTRSYEKDGQTHTSLECRADDIDLLGGGDTKAPRTAERPGSTMVDHDDGMGDSEIPF